MSSRRLVLLVQLPIPPAGAQPVEGNVPLAAAYLKLLAQRRGLDAAFDIELLPIEPANELGDEALVLEIAARCPALVGFTCYLWNIERTLWLCHQLRQRCPETRLVLGGPEITVDNAWVFQSGAFDYAVIGEGEQTFCELLAALAHAGPTQEIPGLAVAPNFAAPPPRRAMDNLDLISSPYLAGLLPPGPTMFLETARGCRFRCKFCYYPKSFTGQSYLSIEQVRANLDFAAEHAVREVFLLDPTLNQRPDFAALVKLLINANPGRKFTYSAELRAEGIDAAMAEALSAANFAEVEIGLQSVDSRTQEIIGRRVNLEAFCRGTKALRAAGIRTRVDLILGLPGDTPASFRRGLDFLLEHKACDEVQVFNLSVLPGTALRQEAAGLGLDYQARPPYYTINTPALDLTTMVELMEEAQDAFDVEFDPAPLPELTPRDADVDLTTASGLRVWRQRCVDLDGSGESRGTVPFSCHRFAAEHDNRNSPLALPPCPANRVVVWLSSGDFHAARHKAAAIVAQLLDANPFVTLDVMFDAANSWRSLTPATLAAVHAACFRRPSYLDRFYSLDPRRHLGAKRLVVVLDRGQLERLPPDWLDAVADFAVVATE